MNIRRVDPDLDVSEISRWFKSLAWDLPPVPDLLPKDGFVAESDGELVACAWLKISGTAEAEILWTCTNPDVSSEKQAQGLTSLIEKLKGICEHISPPIRLIVIRTRNEKFATRLKSLGFRVKFGFYQGTLLVGGKDVIDSEDDTRGLATS